MILFELKVIFLGNEFIGVGLILGEADAGRRSDSASYDQRDDGIHGLPPFWMVI
jgi:hypothetical protein